MTDRRLLICEWEGTLLEDQPQRQAFSQWYLSRCDAWELVYTTGLPFAHLRETLPATSLPLPAALISATGDRIEFFPSGEPPKDWPKPLGPWAPEMVRGVLDRYGQLQDVAVVQGRRVRFRYSIQRRDTAFLVEIRRQLLEVGCQIEVLRSTADQIEIQPAGVHRGTAAALLVAHWGIQPHRVLVAGASDGDLSLFLQGYRGIVVANAAPGLRSLQSPEIYHAQQPYAAGVLEGLEHWCQVAESRSLQSQKA